MDNSKIKGALKKQKYTACLKLMHFVFSMGIFYLFWILFRYGKLISNADIGFRYNYYAAIGYGFVLFFFNRTYNSYLLGYSRVKDLVFAQLLSQLFSVAIIYCSVSLAWNHWRNCLWFLPMMICLGIWDVLWALGANALYFKLYPPKKTILIYRNKLDKKRFGSISGKPSERLYKIVNELEYDGRFTDLRDKLEGYDAVFVAGVNSQCRNGILKYCKEENLAGFVLPHIGDVIMQESVHIQSFDSPVLFVTRSSAKPE